MGMARTIMSNYNFSQKQQETSNVMTALQLMEAPAVAPIAVEEFFAQCIQTQNDDVESMYTFEVPVISTPSHPASPVSQHAAFIFEESIYSLDLAFEALPEGPHANHPVSAHAATAVDTRVDASPLPSSAHHAQVPSTHTEHATPTHLTLGSDSLTALGMHLTQSKPATAAETNTHWNSTSGWGQADVASALEKMLGTSWNSGAEHSAVSAPWYLQSMGFQTAWAHGFTGQGVVIADIDTGIDLSNNLLMKDIKLSNFSKNFIEDNTNIQDDNGHGTVTAAELVANSDSGLGIQGGAYGAELMVLKALGADGSGTHTHIANAMFYAVDHGAQVINLSLGQTLPNQSLQTAMQYASDHGVVVVAAAGNQGTVMPEFPAAYAKQMPEVIAVGASQLVNEGYAMASFSNHSGGSTAYNFVEALGVGITATDLDGSTHVWNGTSMAAPLVAAEVAVLASTQSGWTAAQIVQDIMQSAHALNAFSPAKTSYGSASYQPMDSASHAMSYVPTEQYY